ncbi:hypothetical protein TKK_0012877 [Trichogramma kaykai]
MDTKNDKSILGFFVLAPPPPPPPPIAGHVPALRINTAGEFESRRAPMGLGDGFEPPAAIQNAMMTKDKKPFTYTPGIGGKLDLSMIRSPRMARRVAKNANDEGIDGSTQTVSSPEPYGVPNYPQQQSLNSYSNPSMSVPVYPQNIPQQQPQPMMNNASPRSPPVDRVDGTITRPTVRIETKLQPMSYSPESPNTPTSPTQVTLSKAPTPWMQKSTHKQEELPEWAKRPGINRQQDYPTSPPISENPHRRVVNPAIAQDPKPMLVMRQDSGTNNTPRIEDRPSVFSAIGESGHHQLMNSTQPHHMSRWGNPVGMSGAAPYQPQSGGSYIIPVQIDGQSQQYQQNNVAPSMYANHNSAQYQPNRAVSRVQMPPANQPEPGPLQSNSFRVLQKITGTDADDVDGEQLRRLQLSEDDKYLMNKFKEQVDGEGTSLHNVEDPRYRGSAIPSRAFRFLQNMTDSGDVTNNVNTTSRPVNSAIKKQNRNSNSFDEAPVQPSVYVPASQQQVQEPKKYTGGAIPSRSFRLLQAMTAPENIAMQVTQEKQQKSATNYVSMPSNQQVIYYIPYPNSLQSPAYTSIFWDPEAVCWTYCSIPPNNPFDPYSNPFFRYYHPQYYQSDNLINLMSMYQCTSGSNMQNLNDDSPIVYPNYIPSNEPYGVYAGSQWSQESSVTPTSCATTTTEHSEQSFPPPSPMSSRSSKDDERSEEKNSLCTAKMIDYDNSNALAESSDSSGESDSYMVYSTGINPVNLLKKNITKKIETKINVEDEKNNNFSLGEKLHSERKNANQFITGNQNKDGKILEQTNDHEDEINKTVCVSLPLRLKFSVSDKNEDITTVIVGDSTIKTDEASGNTTLKQLVIQDENEEVLMEKPTSPTLNETSSYDSNLTNESDTKTMFGESAQKVEKDNTRENSFHNDSGTSPELSKIVSNANSSSEVDSSTIEKVESSKNSSTTSRKTNKYQRTQTHSRLFKLLNEELRSESSCSDYGAKQIEEKSSNDTVDKDTCTREQTVSRISRPKSLDCEALFRRYQEQHEDSYYQTWKNKNRNTRNLENMPNVHLTFPHRTNVVCPRTHNSLPRMKSPLRKAPTVISSPTPTSATNPSPITVMRNNRRC